MKIPAYMRDTVTKMTLTSVGAVYRAGDKQVDGRTIKTYLPVSGLNEVPCSVEIPKAQRVSDDAARQTPAHDRIICLPHGVDVLAGDLVRVGTSTWEIIGTDADRTDTLCLRCEAIADTESRMTL